MSRKIASVRRQSPTINFPSLLLLFATSTLFILDLLFITSQTGSVLVMARPSRNGQIATEEQLVELAESSRSAEDADEIRYGFTETADGDDDKANQERELSRDTFLTLDPEPSSQERQRTTSTNSNVKRRQNLRARHREQRKRHRNRNRQQHEDKERNDVDGSREEEEDERNGLEGRSLLSLTSADIVNTTLQANTCRGDLFKHKVRVVGCRPKTITNRFCHGSCSSFYIPRLRSKKLKATFQSCAACIPSETDLVQVRLDCPDREEGHLFRTIVRVKKCACRNIVLEGEENDGDEQTASATSSNDDGMNGGGGEDSDVEH